MSLVSFMLWVMVFKYSFNYYTLPYNIISILVDIQLWSLLFSFNVSKMFIKLSWIFTLLCHIIWWSEMDHFLLLFFFKKNLEWMRNIICNVFQNAWIWRFWLLKLWLSGNQSECYSYEKCWFTLMKYAVDVSCCPRSNDHDYAVLFGP